MKRITRDQLYAMYPEFRDRSPVAGPWTQEEDEQMREMRARGMNVSAISAVLGRSEASCNGRLLRTRGETMERVEPETFANNTLRDAVLDQFDSIVDRTGCSYHEAMVRSGFPEGVGALRG